MILNLIVFVGLAMLIAALVRPFRRASEADARAPREGDGSAIDRKDAIEAKRAP